MYTFFDLLLSFKKIFESFISGDLLNLLHFTYFCCNFWYEHITNLLLLIVHQQSTFDEPLGYVNFRAINNNATLLILCI